jgi:hypothetical protein
VFCSRCGARLPESARFCERCGHAVEADVPSSVTATAARQGRRSVDRTLVAGAAALVVVAAVAAVLLITGAFDSDNGDRSAAGPITSATPSATITPSPTVAETPEPDTAAATPTKPARATVQGTCGRGGAGGDCMLSVRAQPSSASTELSRLSEGDSLRVTCQVHGDQVHSSALGDSSTVWSKTTRGGYVANVYLAGPRLRPGEITLERC